MLEARTIVVTGALGALGSSVADALEAAGAKVARLDHAKVAAKQDLVFDGLDLTDEAATTAAMATIVQRWAASTAWSTSPAVSLGTSCPTPRPRSGTTCFAST